MKKVVLAMFIALMAVATVLYAQETNKTQVMQNVKLIKAWEKEFNSAVTDFYVSEDNYKDLKYVITGKEIHFGDKIKYSGHFLKSKDNKYIIAKNEKLSDVGNVTEGSFMVMNEQGGSYKSSKKYFGDNTEKNMPAYILNNGNYIAAVNDQGWSHLAIMDNNTNKIIKEIKPIDDFYSSGHIDFAEKEDLFVICTVGTEKVHEGLVVLYDYSGNELWRRSLGGGWTGTVAISSLGNYIAALGNEVTTLSTFNKKGVLLWKLDVDVTDIIKYSTDEEYMAICGLRGINNAMKYVSSKGGHILWEYKLNEKRNFYAVAIANNNKYIIGIDGGGSRETPSGNIANVYLFSNSGKVIWEESFETLNRKTPKVIFTNDSQHFVIAIGKKLYCYEIGGVK